MRRMTSLHWRRSRCPGVLFNRSQDLLNCRTSSADSFSVWLRPGAALRTLRIAFFTDAYGKIRTVEFTPSAPGTSIRAYPGRGALLVQPNTLRQKAAQMPQDLHQSRKISISKRFLLFDLVFPATISFSFSDWFALSLLSCAASTVCRSISMCPRICQYKITSFLLKTEDSKLQAYL